VRLVIPAKANQRLASLRHSLGEREKIGHSAGQACGEARKGAAVEQGLPVAGIWDSWNLGVHPQPPCHEEKKIKEMSSRACDKPKETLRCRPFPPSFPKLLTPRVHPFKPRDLKLARKGEDDAAREHKIKRLTRVVVIYEPVNHHGFGVRDRSSR
jgi:hypothetical protein